MKRYRWKKGGRLKKYRNRVKQYKKSKITKENSTNKQGENAEGQTNNQMQRKQNNFGEKIGKEITKQKSWMDK